MFLRFESILINLNKVSFDETFTKNFCDQIHKTQKSIKQIKFK